MPANIVRQMHHARQGAITPEMPQVADKDGISTELVRAEVARGRMIVPANIHHTVLRPMCIGVASKCKISANIGNSPIQPSFRGLKTSWKSCAMG